MTDYTVVKDCLEAARNGRFCAGAECAVKEIERLTAERERKDAVIVAATALIDAVIPDCRTRVEYDDLKDALAAMVSCSQEPCQLDHSNSSWCPCGWLQ